MDPVNQNTTSYAKGVFSGVQAGVGAGANQAPPVGGQANAVQGNYIPYYVYVPQPMYYMPPMQPMAQMPSMQPMQPMQVPQAVPVMPQMYPYTMYDPYRGERKNNVIVGLLIAIVVLMFIGLIVGTVLMSRLLHRQAGDYMYGSVYGQGNAPYTYMEPVPYDQGAAQAYGDSNDTIQQPVPQEEPGDVPQNQGSADVDSWIQKDDPEVLTGQEQYYPNIQDAIRDDLPYNVSWDYYTYAGENLEGVRGEIMIKTVYPVIHGDIPNLDKINDMIQGENRYITEYVDSYNAYMIDGNVFNAAIQGYVTYMDENVLSVVYSETIHTDYWNEVLLYSMNFDVKKGIRLENTQMLSIDDSFSVEFRKRSDEQNGPLEYLTYLTDQDITQYLTNPDNLIVFYTPLGMEVGMNYEEGWVTVTYKDYEKYIKKF